MWVFAREHVPEENNEPLRPTLKIQPGYAMLGVVTQII
jgi:hypothetical protein